LENKSWQRGGDEKSERPRETCRETRKKGRERKKNKENGK
jgi:hypothetical protein